MFPSDHAAKSFSVGKTKAAYVIEGAIAPYLRQKQISQLQKNKFAIVIDESNNVKGKKQLDILVRSFAEKFGNLDSDVKFPLICSSENFSSEILSVLDSEAIPLDNVIAVNRDGPTVMDATLKKLKDKMPHLLDTGSCNLHGVHNATSKAVASSFPFSPVEIIYIFKAISSTRRLENRNLTLFPSCLIQMKHQQILSHLAAPAF